MEETRGRGEEEASKWTRRTVEDALLRFALVLFAASGAETISGAQILSDAYIPKSMVPTFLQNKPHAAGAWYL